jgi:hypothetical protein
MVVVGCKVLEKVVAVSNCLPPWLHVQIELPYLALIAIMVRVAFALTLSVALAVAVHHAVAPLRALTYG